MEGGIVLVIGAAVFGFSIYNKEKLSGVNAAFATVGVALMCIGVSDVVYDQKQKKESPMILTK